MHTERDEQESLQPVATRTRRLSNHSALNNRMDNISTDFRNGASLPLNDQNDGSIHENSLVQPHNLDELADILEKDIETRSHDEAKTLREWHFLLPCIESHMKRRKIREAIKQRTVEQEESLDSITAKAETLVQLIRQSRHIVVYTGAGISTSASIPDYRGPNGLWTQIRKTGSFSITNSYDLSKAEPTYTHMAIKELCKRRIVKHVVSQNCDGLHLRSGIPQANLSEIHGDMYIEVCPTCEKQYFREADITERTSRYRHKTGRKCHTCKEPNNNLIDTIVLYGERSRTKWPMNWERASKAAKSSDLIICMGSSLKTLRRYDCLWPKSSSKREPNKRLAIINLQYTSKDKNAILKINGKCDLVMQLVMQRLKIEVPAYDWTADPLISLSTPFTEDELSHLKRQLIFIDKPSLSISKSPNSTYNNEQPANDSRDSPSLYISELTDDPEKKRLKMRIRAVNMGTAGSNEQSSVEGDNLVQNCLVKLEGGDTIKIDSQTKNQGLPGWLGKSLGASRTSSYKRKKHGNKGRKHTSHPRTHLNE